MGRERRVAWITGAGRGIGRACAEGLARSGMDVVLSSRSRGELDAVKAACAATGVRAWSVPVDVTREADVRGAYAKLKQDAGAPLVLVNGAGLARSASFSKTTPSFMEEMWRINVLGTFYPTQVALPAMQAAKWGRILNIASVSGKVGAPYTSAYASAKHAVVGLTRALATEVAEQGITVNAVCPGYVDTKMTDENVALMVEKTGRTRDQILSYLKSRSPLNRLIRPDEVAAEVVHLAQDSAAGINGQAITIDGGAVQW